MNIHTVIRSRILQKAGLLDVPKKNNINELFKTEWSSKFESLMRNRLVIGAIRYGRLKSKGKPKYDRLESIIKRINKYKETGNDELLVDIANLCLLEFEEGTHQLKHFRTIESDEREGVRKL